MNQSPPVLRTVAALRARVRELRVGGHPVVLVPTMGDLHAGHLQLVRVGARLGPVIVSIFVNPTQFGEGEDFEAYPRNLDGDRAKLDALGLSVEVFAPAIGEVYDRGATTFVEVGGLSEMLCGAQRPGHFRGVATVVTKLFAMAAPDVALFGEKDAQQCLVLRRMVRDLKLPVRLLFVPTVREDDGLAMSSRNRYLQAPDRAAAIQLSQALQAGHALLAVGERDRGEVERRMQATCAGLRLDYAEARTLPELTRPERLEGRILLAIAARVGRARLIDNRALQVGEGEVREVALVDEHCEAAVREELRQAGFTLRTEDEA